MPPAPKKKAAPLLEGRATAAAAVPPAATTGDLAALRNEIAGLRQENLALAARLDATRAVSRSPEDFAAAVKRALDKLQGELAVMSNPTSNFAVREFHLETPVVIDVTALGDVIYRFPGATETPNPATLSRIALDLVPMPKTATTGVLTPDLFQPGTGLEEIEGLEPPLQALLHQNQINTIGDLVATGSRVRSAVELTALLKVDRSRLAVWLTSAELMTLRGIDGGRATVLALAGFTTLRAIATATPEELSRRFDAALKKSGRQDVQRIAAEEAAFLVAAAKMYVGQKAAAVPRAEK